MDSCGECSTAVEMLSRFHFPSLHPAVEVFDEVMEYPETDMILFVAVYDKKFPVDQMGN